MVFFAQFFELGFFKRSLNVSDADPSWRDGLGEDEIEKWGKFWAKSWDLKGNLGLAKLNKRKALLEFEDLEEARRVVSSGSCAWEGTQVRLEHWNPRSGCWVEGEERRDVWTERAGNRRGGRKLRCVPMVGMLAGVEEESAGTKMIVIAGRLGVRRIHARAARDEGLGEREARDAAPVRRWDGAAGGGSGRVETSPDLPDNPELGSSAILQKQSFLLRGRLRTRKLQGVVRLTETDRALEEESMRYGKGLVPGGKGKWGTLILILFFLIGLWGGSFSIILGIWMRRVGPIIQCGLTVYKAAMKGLRNVRNWEITATVTKGREMEGVGDIDDAQVDEKGETERLGTGQRAPNCNCPMKGGLNVHSGDKITVYDGQHCEKYRLGRFLGWKAVNAEGASGGIFICWDRRTLDMLDWEEGQFTLSCRFRNVKMGMSGFLRECMALLLRFLVSPSWIDQFSGINQCRLPRPVSDHFPIMLVGGGIRRGPTPFRFENMWLKAEGFKELVRSWWQGIELGVVLATSWLLR
ncbi:hypothetical protein CK203_070143 [Vitis vinifera]|uniref:DUF4283 domain-containing protein n=1 Tax=Vitis vinifera TaxID=29760 RepID=A0A438EHJ7_VITVI|nr:hypothetical protein CK203_070143 [Vitis vinifera]